MPARDGGEGAGAATKFRLLMWKNALQQWRHRGQTAAELLLPVGTMCLVLILRSQIEPSIVDTTTYPPFAAHSLNFSRVVLGGMNVTRMSVAYSPRSEVLEDVVRSACAKIILRNVRELLPVIVEQLPDLPDLELPDLPDLGAIDLNGTLVYEIVRRLVRVEAYDSGAALRGLYADEAQTRIVIAAAEFDDLLYGAAELPPRMAYALRFPERPRLNSFFARGGRSWRTDSVFPVFELPGPRFPWSWVGGNDPGYVNEMFIALQHMISMELVSRMTGEELDFDVSMNRFPHPPYVQDLAVEALQFLFPMFIMLSFSYTAVNIVRAVTVEKESQLKESMKIMGLPTWLHWTAWFCKQFLYMLFMTALIVMILKVQWFSNEDGFSDYAVFTNTPWTVLFFYITMYLTCTIFFCFMLSGFFSKASTAALFSGVIWYLTYIPAFLLAMDVDMSTAVQVLTCFSINSAMSYGFQLILARESTGGMQWGEFMASPAADSNRFVFGHVLWMLAANCVLYMLVALYLEQVLPGPFGTPRPWYFPFQRQYWLPTRESMDCSDVDVDAVDVTKEKDPTEHAIGVKMLNLTKLFGRNVAVDNLSLNIYDDQITVLLGHNGAGKSTTISMLTDKSFKIMFSHSIVQYAQEEGCLNGGVGGSGVRQEADQRHVDYHGLKGRARLSLSDSDLSPKVIAAAKYLCDSHIHGNGNLAASRGAVWVCGHDVARQPRAARAHLGLCPQHNVLFSELTVREHLEFFARLKGLSGRMLRDDVDVLIEKLELQEKREYAAGGLSGGQKRRLSVGIALSGGARVVLLDEPTSGMDPASRRALWDLLQKEKKGRSMILTTHFMDEADILGDRVAIMAHGRLQCVGSPYFLKRHYGVGYTLVVVKGEGFSPRACTDLINKYIPAAVVKEDRGTEVTYSLTNDYSHTFEEMLNDLENNVDNIRFKNYGLVATTLEDVFMSVGSDLATISSADSDDGAATSTDSTLEDTTKYDLESSLEHLDKSNGSITGIRLWWQHVVAVWLKLWLVWTRSWQLIVLQVLVPVVMINATLGVLRFVVSFTETVQRRMLTLDEGYTSTETLVTYSGASAAASPGALAAAAYELLFSASETGGMALTVVDGQPLDHYYLNRTHDPAAMASLRNQLLIGATFREDSATAWFSNFGYHDAATSLGALHAALLRARDPAASLTVFNHPLEANYRDQRDMELLVTMLSMQLASGIGNSLGIVSAVYIMFYIKERVSRAKLLQKAAGIQPATMWLSAALFDWLWFLVICVPILVSCWAFSVIGLNTGAELGRMFVCMMVYGAAMLPINYVCSYFFKGPALGFVAVFFINVLLGMMGPQIVESLAMPQLDTEHVARGMDAALQFFPLYSLVTAVRLLNQVGLLEFSCLQGCDYLMAVLPNLEECTMQTMCENFSEQCCARENPYWEWESPGVLRYLVCMLVTCAAAWAVLMFFEYRLHQKIFNREKKPPPIDQSTLDPDVADEARHVERVGAAGRGEHSLVAHGLSKYYGQHLAVDQVSFSVSDTECFGLLGVNGAGKTSTFKMLMGDETISSGDAFVSGHSVKKNITKVHENIGYCPQFDAVFGELTGRETLRLFSMLRALPRDDAAAHEALARALGFAKHLDKKVEQYSGGNKRKLSTAVALLGRTRLVFVDEPTTGVDPAAKRQVWRAVQGARRAGRGVVLTSHSMEECEALCTRLTIMVNGRFQCLGTPQHLKNKFSEGFTLSIKLKLDEETAADSTEAERLTGAVKCYVHSNFTNPRIMEEYQGLLTYYLPDRSMPWSRMFGVLERAKRELGVEDYSISQTTLEQIFLQFTKYQRGQDEP